ncbi:MAG: hypothetical protein GVY19_05470 [Bacteroidetes bacterium]|jgi:hypothetical protein|nr:hypothetical protein [Bacteroidota bacterium]
MKNFLMVFLFCGLTSAYGQQNPSKPPPKAEYYRAGIGLSAGMNNFSGIVGGIAEYQWSKHFSFVVGGGYSYWGGLGSVGLRYYDKYPVGFSFLLAYNHAFGIDDVNLTMETEQDSTIDVSFRYDPASSVQFAFSYFWQTGKSNRFYISAGYSVKLWNEPYEIIAPDGIRLTNSSKRLVEFRPPGGVVIGLGYMFGFGY